MDATELEKAGEILKIDEGSLDTECLRHPRRVLRWVLLEAEAKQDVALAKARLDLVRARLRNAVRADPARHGLKDKPAKDLVDDAAEATDDYQAALAELIAAEAHVDQVKGVVSGLHEKRRAIERLVELKQIDYYAEPRPKVPNGAMQEGTKRAARGPIGRKEERDDA